MILLLPFRSPNNVREISMLSLVLLGQESPGYLAVYWSFIEKQVVALPSKYFVYSVWSCVFTQMLVLQARNTEVDTQALQRIFYLGLVRSGLDGQISSA